MARLTYFLLLMAVFIARPSFAQPVLSKAQWLEDCNMLQKAVYEKHIDPFWKHPKPMFDSLFAQIRNNIENAGDNTLTAGMALTGFTQILALTADGHSGVSTKSRGELLGLYNYSVSWFPEGLFITRTDEQNKSILGSRITMIDNTPIEQAKEKLATVSTSFHEQGFKRFSPRYFESPVVLYGLGIAKSSQQVTLTVQTLQGNIEKVVFQKQSVKEQSTTRMLTLADVSGSAIPLYRQNTQKNYWFDYLPDEKIIYVNFLQVQNSKEDPMEAFVKRLSMEVAKKEVSKFVIDIRQNPGGDQFTAWPLLAYIMSDPKINQPGKLFVITGHNTFSAATAFLEAMETKTECIIAGTATSDSPQYPAEPGVTVLPNSRMEVRLSDEMWNYSFDDDTRNIIAPDLQVIARFDDYLKGRDPVLEAIIQYKTVPVTPATGLPTSYAGRYLFGIDKTLTVSISNGIVKADIPGRLHTTLTSLGANKYGTGIRNMTFTFNDQGILVHFPAGTKKLLRKLDSDEQTAFDLVLSGQYDKALQAYKALHQKFPSDININGANLAGLAFYLVVETQNFAMGKALAEIAIELDPHSKVAKGLLQGMNSFGK